MTDGGTRRLEVYPSVVAADSTYGCFNKLAVDLDIQIAERPNRTGVANSTDLINAACTSPAAEAIFAFSTAGGAVDWYLPSANELIMFLSTLSSETFKRDPGSTYWPSSEQNQGNAFIVFDRESDTEVADPVDKINVAPVLAIRTF